MEPTRVCVEDTIFALLVTYLKLGSRDVVSDFAPHWRDSDRLVQVDSVNFQLVRKLIGQEHEIPGVNLVFYDSLPIGPRTNPPTYALLSTIHLYCESTANNIADARTHHKLQRLVDEAFFVGGVGIMDFYTLPAQQIGRKIVHWGILTEQHGWKDLTDLANTGYLHSSKDLELVFEDQLIT